MASSSNMNIWLIFVLIVFFLNVKHFLKIISLKTKYMMVQYSNLVILIILVVLIVNGSSSQFDKVFLF